MLLTSSTQISLDMILVTSYWQGQTFCRVLMPVGNLGNRGEFASAHSQPVICWEFVTLQESVWESTNSVSFGKMTSKIILKKKRKVGNCSSEKSWELCSFDLEIVGDFNNWNLENGSVLICESWEFAAVQSVGTLFWHATRIVLLLWH